MLSCTLTFNRFDRHRGELSTSEGKFKWMIYHVLAAEIACLFMMLVLLFPLQL